MGDEAHGGVPEGHIPSRDGYAVNARGQTYGRVLNSGPIPEADPDLVAAIGDDGTIGYVLATELAGPHARNPVEALAIPRGPRPIILYDSDGTTVVGTFTVGRA